eukprot:c12560_g1_i2 orf=568-777(+)
MAFMLFYSCDIINKLLIEKAHFRTNRTLYTPLVKQNVCKRAPNKLGRLNRENLKPMLDSIHTTFPSHSP